MNFEVQTCVMASPGCQAVKMWEVVDTEGPRTLSRCLRSFHTGLLLLLCLSRGLVQ